MGLCFSAGINLRKADCSSHGLSLFFVSMHAPLILACDGLCVRVQRPRLLSGAGMRFSLRLFFYLWSHPLNVCLRETLACVRAGILQGWCSRVKDVALKNSPDLNSAVKTAPPRGECRKCACSNSLLMCQ